MIRLMSASCRSVAFLLACVGPGAAASRQAPQEPASNEAFERAQRWDQCAADDVEASIAACTALIEGGETGEELVTALANRGISYGQQREFDRAIGDFDRAFRLNRDNTDIRDILLRALVNRGTGLYIDGQYDEALGYFARAVEASPGDAVARAWVGIVQNVRGQYDLAIESLNESVTLDPSLSGAWFYRGVAYFGKRQYERARAEYEEALKLNPQWPLALFARGVLREATGDPAGGRADMDAARAAQPDIADALVRFRIEPQP